MPAKKGLLGKIIKGFFPDGKIPRSYSGRDGAEYEKLQRFLSRVRERYMGYCKAHDMEPEREGFFMAYMLAIEIYLNREHEKDPGKIGENPVYRAYIWACLPKGYSKDTRSMSQTRLNKKQFPPKGRCHKKT